MKIAIGSHNKTKVGAVQDVFPHATVLGVKVPSHVSEQPMTDAETLQGAKNRARNCLAEGDFDIGIGLEGGVIDTREAGMLLCNWGALADRQGHIMIASGARITLPNEVAEGVRSGIELAKVMEEYTLKQDVRSNEGAIGIFTNGMIDRKEMFVHVVKLLAGQYQFCMK